MVLGGGKTPWESCHNILITLDFTHFKYFVSVVVGASRFATYSCPTDVAYTTTYFDLYSETATNASSTYVFRANIPSDRMGYPLEVCTVSLDMSLVASLHGTAVVAPNGTTEVPVFFSDGIGPQIVASNLPADGFVVFPDTVFDLELDLDVPIESLNVELYCLYASYASVYSYPDYELASNGTHISLSMSNEDFMYSESGPSPDIEAGSCHFLFYGWEAVTMDEANIQFDINWRLAGSSAIGSIPWVEVRCAQECVRLRFFFFFFFFFCWCVCVCVCVCVWVGCRAWAVRTPADGYQTGFPLRQTFDGLPSCLPSSCYNTNCDNLGGGWFNLIGRLLLCVCVCVMSDIALALLLVLLFLFEIFVGNCEKCRVIFTCE